MALSCRKCGCTTERACPGGCSWVSINPPVCSACVEQDVGGGGVELRSHADGPEGCPARAGGIHKPIWTSDSAGYCIACAMPFTCREAA